MFNVLIFGAGRSSGALIDYLLQQKSIPLKLTVADQSLDLAQSKIGNASTKGTAVQLDINNDVARKALINKHDIVLSLLPAHLHHIVAEDAIESNVHMITASYISEELKRLDERAKRKGLLIMGELGLDPGLDHMSAMKEIENLRTFANISGFKSATGGVVAPESKDNPWGYKVTWNPRNVVLAGTSGAAFLQNGERVEYDYTEVFSHLESWNFPSLGNFEVYANRDSFKYRVLYNLDTIKNLYRGTIRYSGYCGGWDILRKMGLTSDSDNTQQFETHRDWVTKGDNDLKNIEQVLKNRSISFSDRSLELINSLDLLSEDKLPKGQRNSADILQNVIETKWKMNFRDKDMILMQHQYLYEHDGKKFQKNSSLYYVGNDAEDTAMSRLVGLPMGIFAVNILQGIKIPYGVQIPIYPSVYIPVMDELATYGVNFVDEIQEIGLMK